MIKSFSTKKRPFRFVMLFFASLFLLIPSLWGQEKAETRRGAAEHKVKGYLQEWSAVKKFPFSGPRQMRPVLNFERNIEYVKTGDRDMALQPPSAPLEGARGMLAMPSPLQSFAGLNFSANGAGWPPDTTGDVGLNHYVQAVNTSIGIFRKSDGALLSATTFNAFFGGTGISGTPCDNNNNGDPIVLFDRYAQRWFILDFAWYPTQSGGTYFSIAASQTSDPTGAWWQYAFQSDSTLMSDYPKVGIWNDGIYITANMFNFSTLSYQHTKIWAIKKPELYNGTLVSQSTTTAHSKAFGMLPANSKGVTAPSSANYLYTMDANEFGSGHTDAVCVWRYAVNWTTPANTTFTGPTVLAAASFSLTTNRVPQQGTSVQLDSLAGRLMYPATYRSYGSHESVYLCHVVDNGSSRGMRWYELRVSGGTHSIYQQGTYAPDSNYRWMGSICADKNGNVAMGYSVSSSSMYPAIRYAGRLAADPLGQLAQGESTLTAGGGHQTTYTRWGDYSTMTIDPTDDETFWYTQEYYASSGTNWQTRIGSFKYSAVTPPSSTPPPLAEDLVPVMTSNTAPSGVAEASSVYANSADYQAWKAFDGEDVSGAWSRWISAIDYGYTTPQWITYQFAYPRYITGYYILPEYGSTTKDRSPKNWRFEGWNGSSWVVLDTRDNIRNDIEWSSVGLYFIVQNPGVYTKYRLYVTAVNGSDVVSIRKIKMYSIGEVPFMTSNTAPSGVAAASSVYGGSASYQAWKAFDGNDQSEGWSRWISQYDAGFVNPQWVSYNFGIAKRITRYYILPEYAASTKNRTPKNWQLQGWNGSSWVTLDTRSNYRLDIEWNAGGLYFTVASPGDYSQYRLYVTAVNGSDVTSIRQFHLFK